MTYHKVWGMHDPTWQLAFPLVAIIAILLMLLLFQLFLIKRIIRVVRIGSAPFLQRTEKSGGIAIVRNVILFSIHASADYQRIHSVSRPARSRLRSLGI
jgi:hypothetical protein